MKPSTDMFKNLLYGCIAYKSNRKTLGSLPYLPGSPNFKGKGCPSPMTLNSWKRAKLLTIACQYQHGQSSYFFIDVIINEFR